MVNPDYVDGNPFVLKGEGLPVESINNFILLGGSLEGSVDVVAPTNFENEEWSNQETPQKALFCKFTLQNMSGINNNSSLEFSNGQGCVIKSEIFLQLLEKVSKIQFAGTGLSGLTVNVLKNYPVTVPGDTLFSNIGITGDEIALLDSLMDNSSFYLQIIGTGNAVINSITLTIATKKLGGAANIQFDDENLRINRVNLEGSDILPIERADLSGVLPITRPDLSGVFPLSVSDIPTIIRSKISDLLPINRSDLGDVLPLSVSDIPNLTRSKISNLLPVTLSDLESSLQAKIIGEKDVVQGTLTIPAGATRYIKPPTGISWLIQNISCTTGLVADSYNLYFVRDVDKGNITCITENVTATGFINDLVLHCTSDYYFGIKNTSAEDLIFVYNGIVSNDGANGTIVVNNFVSLNGGATFAIQPPIGQEWQINAIFGNSPSIDVSWNGSGALIASTSTLGWIAGLKIGITNTNYIIVQNTSSAAHGFGFIGVRTK